MEYKKILFPYQEVRPIQDDMMKEVGEAISQRKKILLHAPTGIGKTIAVLGPALAYALENNKTIVFLTSRHTQHIIALETLDDIKKKYDKEFVVADLIGKKWMCALPEMERVSPHEFRDYCRILREEDNCKNYINTYDKRSLSVKAKKVKKELSVLSPCHSENIVEMGKKAEVCPYEIALSLCKDAKVIIADYFYLFNPSLRESFLGKIGKNLDDIIVIVDEGHNLSNRVRDLLSLNISTLTIKRAINEANDYGYKGYSKILEEIGGVLEGVSVDIGIGGEVLVNKKYFIDLISDIKDYASLFEELEFIAEDIRKKKKQSSIGAIAHFLESWLGTEEGYVRIISKKDIRGTLFITLSYRCLDPSLVTSEVLMGCYSLVMVSGTLLPTALYRDILGFPKDSLEKVYPSPFPRENRLTLIVPKTTTRFSLRSENQFKEIARRSAEMVERIPGNNLVFFPSYDLRNSVYHYFKELCDKDIVLEKQGLNKEEKKEILDGFKQKEKEIVLLAVASGSFGEGIDLPGNLLNGVIVVGIPLQRPDLEIKALINYYEKRFGKGWDYGYVLPAITTVLQNAGRCIRSETDRGVIVFLDERYAWQRYLKCFPADFGVEITMDYNTKILNFFSD